MLDDALTSLDMGWPGSVNMKWTEFYSDKSLKKLGLPSFKGRTSEPGSFRQPVLTWSEALSELAGTVPDFLGLFCDVLILDTDMIVDVPTFIYARQIISPEGRKIIVDRTSDPSVEFRILVQDIQDASGASTPLDFDLAYRDEQNVETTVNDKILAQYSRIAAWALVLEDGSNELKAASREEVASVFLSDGEQLPLLLNTQFNLAALYFHEHKQYARQILEWISSVCESSDAFSDLSAQAHGLHQTILGQIAAERQGCVLVPSLDHEIYADEAKSCLALLNRREAQLKAFETILANDQNWAADARAALQDHQVDLDLTDQLLAQARKTRDQAAGARQAAMHELTDEQTGMVPIKAHFDTGIKHWQTEQTVLETLNLVSEVGTLLSQIPAIMVAGPELAAMPAIQTADAFISFMAEGTKSVVSLPKKARTHIRERRSKKPSNPSYKLTYDEDEIIGGEGDAERVGGEGQLVVLVQEGVGQHDDEDGDDEDGMLLARRRKEPEKIDFEFLKSDPNAPGANPPMSRAEVNEAIQKGSSDQAIEFRKLKKAARASKKQRTLDQQKLVTAVKTAGKSTIGITKSIMKLCKIAQQAADLEEASNDILATVNSNLGISLSAIDPVGIDVATGGAQVYDLLKVEIDNVFETVAGGAFGSITGGNAYQQSFHRLIIKGKAMCLARLALAKANAELTTAILRNNSAKRALAIFEKREQELNVKVLHDETVRNAAFERMIENKRGVFLAMEAYQRAFRYYTLSSERELPSLPSIAASNNEFNEAVERIASHKLELTSLQSHFSGFGEFDLDLRIDDPVTLDSLRANKQQLVKLPTIKIERPEFRLMRRVRLDEISFVFEGLETDQVVAVEIFNNGTYHDRSGENLTTAKSTSFSSMPAHMLYSFQKGRATPINSTKLSLRLANAFFKPTPFTDWQIQVSHQNGSPIDLSGVTAILMNLKGENAI